MSDELYTGGYLPISGDGQPEGEQPEREQPPIEEAAEAAALGGALLDAAFTDMVAAAGPVPEIEEYVDRPSPPLLVVLTGPSGVGKDVTLERMNQLGVPFHYVVTVTTRKIR